MSSGRGGLCEGGGEEKKADDVRTTTALQQRLLPFLGPAYAQKQSPSVGSVGLSTSSTPRNLSSVSPSSGSDRVPLSATQVKLLKELMGSDSQKDVLQRMLHDQTGEGGGRSLTSNIQLACGGGGGGFCNNSTSENNNSSMASENAQQNQAKHNFFCKLVVVILIFS